MNYLTVTEAGY